MSAMKGKLFLIDWNATSCEKLRKELLDEGWQITGTESEEGGRACKLIKQELPDVVVISLVSKPSHGIEVARSLEETKATSKLPIIFIDGDEKARKRALDIVGHATAVRLEDLQILLMRVERTLNRPSG